MECLSYSLFIYITALAVWIMNPWPAIDYFMESKLIFYFYRFSIEYLTVESAQTTLVPKGSTVTLKCSFDSLLDCVWERRDRVIQMGGRYHYYQNDIEKSKDCSLKIENFQEIDVGQWKCNIFTDSSPYLAIDVKHSWLNLYGRQNMLSILHWFHIVHTFSWLNLPVHYIAFINCFWNKFCRT